MKILLVEDNPKMRRLLAEFVGPTCAQIYECADGDAAFALYEQNQPDWVLMDWQMPHKDGLTATREIIAKYPAANICLVTNHNDDFLKAEALAAGVKCFVLKRNLAELRALFT